MFFIQHLIVDESKLKILHIYGAHLAICFEKLLPYSNCDVLLNISDLTCGVTAIILKSGISRYSLSWFVKF